MASEPEGENVRQNRAAKLRRFHQRHNAAGVRGRERFRISLKYGKLSGL